MIDLEIYLERNHSNGNDVEKTTLIEGAVGRGEYVVREYKRLYIRTYVPVNTENNFKTHIKSVRQVSIGLGEDIGGVIDLDESGVGRMYIPPDQWLVVRDNTVLQKMPN